MNKTLKTIMGTAALGLATILTKPVFAAPSLDVNVLVDVPKAEQNVVRLNGFSMLPGNTTTSGFVDFSKEGNFYSEVSIAKSLLGNTGIKGEWNGAPGFNLFRLGANETFSGKYGFLDLKALPLTINSDGTLQKSGQIGMFGKLSLPKGISLENWTDLNISYADLATFVQSEVTVLKSLTDKISIFGDAQYNISAKDKIDYKIGARYNF